MQELGYVDIYPSDLSSGLHANLRSSGRICLYQHCLKNLALI